MGALSNEGFEGFESFWGVAKKKNEKSTSKNPNPGANDLGISIIKTKTGRYTKGLAVSWSWPVKMNKRMSELLTRLEIPADLSHDIHPRALLATADFVTVDGSVLLRSEHEKNRHVKAPDFPDRTGFECFVNHLHLPFNGTRESLLKSLGYAIALRHALSSFEGKTFLVIASVAVGECTIRFHQLRQNESWVSEDLERYGSEAILLLNSRAPA